MFIRSASSILVVFVTAMTLAVAGAASLTIMGGVPQAGKVSSVRQMGAIDVNFRVQDGAITGIVLDGVGGAPGEQITVALLDEGGQALWQGKEEVQHETVNLNVEAPQLVENVTGTRVTIADYTGDM